MLQTIYKGDYIQIHHAPSQSLLVLEWNGCLPSDTYRTECNRVLELAKLYQVRYMLSDDRKLGPILLTDKNWTCSMWMPRFAQTSIEKVSVLVSHDILSIIPVQEIMLDSTKYGSFEHQYSFDYPSAVEWLNLPVHKYA